MTVAARLAGVHKTYRRAGEAVHALRAVDLSVAVGEVVALVGPSGSGKSTALLVLGGWETPDAGEVFLAERSDGGPPPWAQVGVVPQGLGLLEDLTVRDNVLLPVRLAGRAPDRTAADDLLRTLDLADLADRQPAEISLGQQQRAAVARALVLQPHIVLADEPTTHQDGEHAATLFGVLRSVAERGGAVVVATHDPAGAAYADRVVQMADGRVLGAEPSGIRLRRR
ncbi:MAG TPA: ATP-binding cassette domain-containing protein [Mycobacteriales bacterium]|jgi:putative ABC transport system ATP-binding protein|nr:ATP-binding cassette domain-containing protein [Mycobacteriales bacterium]